MASKDYIQAETTTQWDDAGTDKVMPFTGLAADAVVCGAALDLGAAPRPDEFTVEVTIDGFGTTTVVGEDVPIYFAQSEDGTNFDGSPNTEPTTTTAGAYTTAQLPNLLGPVDFLIQTDVTATTTLKVTSAVRLTSRYIAPVIHNNTADAFATTASATHKVILTPKPREGQ
jgi:hypothetical protein